MGTTYVLITRLEFEEWLSGLPYRWSRNERTAGIYYVEFSPLVGVKISSSIGNQDDAMGRGQASIDLALVSIPTQNVLNRKAQSQSRYHRTKGWRENLKKGLAHWEQVYRANQDFYDLIAPIKDRAKYQRERIQILSQIPGREQDEVLTRMQDILEKNGVLLPFQERVIEIAKALRPDQIEFLAKLEKLRGFVRSDPGLPSILVEARRYIWRGDRIPQDLRTNILGAFSRFNV